MPTFKSVLILATSITIGGLTALPSKTLSAEQIPDKYRTPDEVKLKHYEKRADSLVLAWSNKCALDTTKLVADFLGDDALIPSDIPDSVFIKRLSRVPSLIDLPYNNVVRASILWYTVRRRHVAEKILGLTDYYFPIFEQTLDKHDLPIELRYLPIIESALNPIAVSRVGATGLWQFMYGTGKQYNLNITSFIDERRDPIAASEAAAKFLKDLYKVYKDWTLVIAAYNCGPRNVNKAIRRAGGSKNYWAIYNYLPKETRGYVPNFIAAAYLVKYYKEHNLTPRTMTVPRATDSIQVNRMLHFQQIADVLPVSVDQLRELNPQYKKDIIPGIEKTYTLILPLSTASQFIAKEEEIYKRDSLYFVQNNFPSLMASNGEDSANHEHKTIYHKVRKGETLSVIADKFGVDVASIKKWNKGKIRKNRLVAGLKLTIKKEVRAANSTPNSTIAQNTNNKVSADSVKIETVKTLDQSATAVAKKTDTAKETKENGKVVFYTVKKNDSLWKIAQKYEGVSAKDIQTENNIESNKGLKVGQKLRITIN